jgi:hypothetical protein
LAEFLTPDQEFQLDAPSNTLETYLEANGVTHFYYDPSNRQFAGRIDRFLDLADRTIRGHRQTEPAMLLEEIRDVLNNTLQYWNTQKRYDDFNGMTPLEIIHTS